MWRSLIIASAFALSACGYHLEPDGSRSTETQPVAESAAAPVENAAKTEPAPPPAEPLATAQAQPTAIDSGVIREYCVQITFETHFRPGTTEAQVRTFADTINQRLCVDGHPTSGTASGTDKMQNGQEIKWSAVFL